MAIVKHGAAAPRLRVLSVASEAVPLVKTGGLADVAGALPGALAPHGVELTTLLPGYPAVMAAIQPGARRRLKVLHTWDGLLGVKARLVAATLGSGGAPLLVLDAPDLYAREGGPYADNAGRDWPDNWRRFAALGRAAADLAGGATVLGKAAPGFDLVHAHDWQAALALAYLRFAPVADARAVSGVMTIHNMAFQGRFDRDVFGWLGLPVEAYSIDGVEYHGGVGYLKAGMAAAAVITTVSPTYAHEIREPAFGMGLDGLVRARGARVLGVVNGIDTDEWNPAADPALAARYTARTLDRRCANKRALEAEFALDRDDGPLFIVISRLTAQKGIDVLCEVLDHLVGLGGRLALLGTGEAGIEAELWKGAQRHPGRVGLRFGYDEGLAHRLQAGGDAILVPSRFEPCGLTQLYGLRYGCVPVVARTGGLADTVIDANPAAIAARCATGLQFDGVDYPGLARAIDRTFALWRQPEVWRSLQVAGMKADFSWAASGATYAQLYRDLIEEQQTP